MRIFTWQRLGIATLMFLFLAVGVQAQKKISPVTVIQKSTNEDGSTTVIKKRFDNKEALQSYLKEINAPNAGNFEIQISDNPNDVREIEIGDSDGHTMIYMRRKGDHHNSDVQFRKMEVKIQKQMAEMGERMERLHLNPDLHLAPDFHFERRISNKPMLGVYIDESADVQGVKVSSMVAGGGAKAAGIQADDIITGINDVSIQNRSDLRTELNKYKPGETVDVTYIRDGLTSTTESTLYRSRSSWERDPCEVFIGVSLGGNGPEGKGVHVSNIISDTPAEKYGLKAGDIITAFDGVLVNSYGELLRERNKHEPGDWFKVKVIREGLVSEVSAQFKSCNEEIEEPLMEEELVEEVIEVLPEPEVTKEEPKQPEIVIDNTLELSDYQAFPNPTYGQFNLNFTAEPVPTQVRVVDVSGKIVYNENLNRFDGFYSNQIHLSKKAIPGTLFLQIIQGEKMNSQKIVLVPRA